MNIDKALLLAILSASSLAACTPLTPNLDSTFGNAVNMAKAQQTLNPEASLDTSVTTMSGKEGNLVVDAYHETLKAPPPPTTVINIGGGLSSGN